MKLVKKCLIACGRINFGFRDAFRIEGDEAFHELIKYVRDNLDGSKITFTAKQEELISALETNFVDQPNLLCLTRPPEPDLTSRFHEFLRYVYIISKQDPCDMSMIEYHNEFMSWLSDFYEFLEDTTESPEERSAEIADFICELFESTFEQYFKDHLEPLLSSVGEFETIEGDINVTLHFTAGGNLVCKIYYYG